MAARENLTSEAECKARRIDNKMKDVKGSTPALKPQKISHKTTDRCRHSNNIIHAASSSKTVKLYTNMKKEKDSSAGAIINAADASGHVEFLRLAACQNFFTSPQPNSKQSTSPCVTTIDVKKLKTWQKTFNKKSELMLMRHARAYGSSCSQLISPAIPENLLNVESIAFLLNQKTRVEQMAGLSVVDFL